MHLVTDPASASNRFHRPFVTARKSWSTRRTDALSYGPNQLITVEVEGKALAQRERSLPKARACESPRGYEADMGVTTVGVGAVGGTVGAWRWQPRRGPAGARSK